MNFLIRTFQRLLLFVVSMGVLWVIVTQIFFRFHERLPFVFAVMVTYLVSAYIFLPQAVHFGVMVARRGRIPRVIHAPDGLADAPVNIVLLGTIKELQEAFVKAGWYQADALTFRSAWKMAKCFILNTPYPQAPFSSRYLFGRGQDIGFQEAIGHSPRQRHHIRFWAANIDPEAELLDLQYWLKKHPIDPQTSHIWVGAGSLDLGFGLASLTYQISHQVDTHVDLERDYIFRSLTQNGLIHDEHFINPGEAVGSKYISDGRILWGKLGASVENK